mmetsp:Transcript_81252/g.161209  ORF Transcript_81252/g.161209 Transcript_81252/m.161209 type:complete len:83 (+) Transcript_81252:711-959(+)
MAWIRLAGLSASLHRGVEKRADRQYIMVRAMFVCLGWFTIAGPGWAWFRRLAALLVQQACALGTTKSLAINSAMIHVLRAYT